MVALTAVRTAVPMAVRTAVPMVARTAVPTAVRTAVRTAVPMVAPMAEPMVAQTADVDPVAAAQGGTPARPALRRCTSVAPDLFAAEVWGEQASLSRRE